MNQNLRHRFIAHRAVIENQKILSPAVIDVESGIITKVSETIPSQNWGETIDLKEMFLFPGFVNAHCHIELTALGPLAESCFVPWIKKIGALIAKLDATQIQSGIKNGISRLLKSGVTTVFDHVSPHIVSSHTPWDYFQNSEIDVVSFGEVLGINLDKATQSYSQAQQVKKKYKDLHITPHAIHSVHPEILKSVFSEETGPFSIHMAESSEEKIYFENKSGDLFDFMAALAPGVSHKENSGISWLEKNSTQDFSSLWIHGNFLNDADLNWLQKQKKPCVVHCPGSFAHFQHSTFPKNKITQRGIKIALGTDSLASNTDLNILLEAQRYLERFPETGFEEVLEMLTVNAARAIGLNDMGEIKEGQKAHLIGFKSQNAPPLELIKTRKSVDFMWKETNRLI